MRISPANPKFIYLFGTAGFSFYSENCGIDYKMILHHAELTDFKLNKKDLQLILAFAPYECATQVLSDCDENESELYLSTNQGKTWSQI